MNYRLDNINLNQNSEKYNSEQKIISGYDFPQRKELEKNKNTLEDRTFCLLNKCSCDDDDDFSNTDDCGFASTYDIESGRCICDTVAQCSDDIYHQYGD